MAESIYKPASQTDDDSRLTIQDSESQLLDQMASFDPSKYRLSARLSEADSNNLYTNPPKPRRKKTEVPFRLLCWDWILDILSCLLAILALIGIVVTLRVYENRLLPDWPFGISLNALVSIFSVIFKGAMMAPVARSISQLQWTWFLRPRPLSDTVRYDSASRGIWGCIQLLSTSKAHLVTLGAVITILAIASDPFIQQVVKYRPCLQSTSNGTAILPTVNFYSEDGDTQVAPGDVYLGASMQAAIYEGAYNSFSSVTFTCTTGNCSFPEFRTTGMCSNCIDISSELDFSHEPSCANNISLPSGVNISVEESYVMNIGPEVTYFDKLSFPFATDIVYFANESAAYTDLAINNAEECTAFINAIEPTATKCTLYPCVRTYHANVTEGRLTEDLLSTIPMELESGGAAPYALPYTAVPMPCLINGTYCNNSSCNNETGNALPPECLFQIPSYGAVGLVDYLPIFFSGSYQSGVEIDYANPAYLKQLWNGGNITVDTLNTSWAAIAESITVQMRQTGDRMLNINGTVRNYVVGTTYRTETCVTVDWAWLSLPAGLLVFAIAFLAATIVQSRHEALWKSSPLALLFYGLDDSLRCDLRREHKVAEVEKAAQNMMVKLGGGDEKENLMFVSAPRRRSV